MKQKKLRVLSFLSGVAMLPIAALPIAAQAGGPEISPPSYQKFEADFGLGMYSGKVNESVFIFDTSNTIGRKASLLPWNTNAAPILKADVEWFPSTWVSVGASGWAAVASLASNMMDDYDWTDPNQTEYNLHSNHPDTKLDQAYSFDPHVVFWPLVGRNYRLGIMGGYQWDEVSFQANGGVQSYFNNTVNLQAPPSQPQISYRQLIRLPYLGLDGEYRCGNFVFDAMLKFSEWVTVSPTDIHWNTPHVIRDRFNHQAYFSAFLKASYYVATNTKVFLSGSWDNFYLVKGAAYRNTLLLNSTARLPNFLDGASSHNYTVVAGLQWDIY